MALITIGTSNVSRVSAVEEFHSISGSTITPGQFCRLDGNGKFIPGSVNDAAAAEFGGVAIAHGDTGADVTIMRRGVLNVGNALANVAFGSKIFLGSVAGEWRTEAFGTAGTVDIEIGTVVPAWGNGGTADKLLAVDVRAVD
jgi:hypothetical protein